MSTGVTPALLIELLCRKSEAIKEGSVDEGVVGYDGAEGVEGAIASQAVDRKGRPARAAGRLAAKEVHHLDEVERGVLALHGRDANHLLLLGRRLLHVEEPQRRVRGQHHQVRL